MKCLIGQFWKRAGNDLGIRVETPFELTLKDGSRLKFEVLVKDFGDKLGMLITTDHKKLDVARNELEALGYGYSTMSDYSQEDIYSVDNFKYVLKDWGWSGDPADTPTWLNDVPDPFAGYDYSDDD
jgi:hypothetical protein